MNPGGCRTPKRADAEHPEWAQDAHLHRRKRPFHRLPRAVHGCCLLYTSDAADERSSVDLGGRRIIKKKKEFFFFKQKTAYEMLRSLVGSEMCIRDRRCTSSSTKAALSPVTTRGPWV